MDNTKLTSVRCCNHRPHLKYDTCGRILCAIKDGRIFLYCSQCKQFFEMIVYENDNVELKPVPKNTRFDLETRLRVIGI